MYINSDTNTLARKVIFNENVTEKIARFAAILHALVVSIFKNAWASVPPYPRRIIST